MKIIEGQSFDEERALYAARDVRIVDCRFEGPADGESALKESRQIEVADSLFVLRYPLWHTTDFKLRKVKMADTARAAIWYAKNGIITDSDLGGIKAVRESSDISIRDTKINSSEFGWKSSGIRLENVDITSEYLFLDSRDISLENVDMHGKYSFQYVENMNINNSRLDTKDAFWHTKNVTVRDSVVKGEYLAWYSENLTLINCEIIGTQPLCYCKGLKLINCTMKETDLAFEYSDVEADIIGSIDSVKNPRSGRITADAVGEIIMDSDIVECRGEVIVR